MNIDQIIRLFEEVEAGKEGQLLGFHLHDSVRRAADQVWITNGSYPCTFSGFLRALKDADLE